MAQVPDAQVMSRPRRVGCSGPPGTAATQAKLAITGFCWGGRIVWLYAARSSTTLKAGVAWYGQRRRRRPRRCSPKHDRPTSRPISTLRCSGLYGGADAGIPERGRADRMRAAIRALRASPPNIHVYPDTPHGVLRRLPPELSRGAMPTDGWQRSCSQWFQPSRRRMTRKRSRLGEIAERRRTRAAASCWKAATLTTVFQPIFGFREASRRRLRGAGARSRRHGVGDPGRPSSPPAADEGRRASSTSPCITEVLRAFAARRYPAHLFLNVFAAIHPEARLPPRARGAIPRRPGDRARSRRDRAHRGPPDSRFSRRCTTSLHALSLDGLPRSPSTTWARASRACACGRSCAPNS